MSSAFHLATEDDGLATVTFDLPDRKVNIFTTEVMQELQQLVLELAERRDIGCLVLLSGKRGNFIAGADVDGIASVTDPIEAENASRHGQRIFQEWEELPFPTVAAVRGTCVGGGTELALASDYIVVSDRDDIRIGLPEIKLGILPAWGGCTRMPERIGLTDALDLILAGKTVHPKKAFKIGLADALLPDAAFPRLVREFAVGKIGSNGRAERSLDLKSALLEGNPVGRKLVFDQARKRTLEKTKGNYPAPLRAIEVIKVALEHDRRAGFDAEARAVGELATSGISKSLVHVFRLSERAKKDPEDAPRAHPVRRTAVVGAGVMGGGIAQLLAAKGDLPVRLKDIDLAPLAGGMEHAAGLFDKLVSKRRLSAPEAKRKLALLHPTLDYSGFSDSDLVIEAIVEVLEVKQKVFAEIASQVPEDTVLATNTSSLSIDAIGAETPHPERVVGMHFFNPVHKMPLVEVIQGPRTSREATQTIVELARRLGKTPVVVRDGPGFLVNRLLTFYNAEALWLLDEGLRMEVLDRAMRAWGMPMGPIELTDEVGIDVANKVAHIMQEAYPDRLELPGWMDELVEEDRLGSKTGKGLYRYEDGRRTEPDEAIYELLGIPGSIREADESALAERLVLPMVDEAARCLDDGIVSSPGDIDLALIMGTGFPPFRGGLCRWADQQGLERLLEEMERLGESVAERHRPSEALRRIAANGGFYA